MSLRIAPIEDMAVPADPRGDSRDQNGEQYGYDPGFVFRTP